MRLSTLLLGASLLLASARASAQDPPPPDPAPAAAPSAAPADAPAPAPAPAPAHAPAPARAASGDADLEVRALAASEKPSAAAEGPRSEGMRLGLELGFARSSGDEADRVNAGSPSMLPLGADVSWRTSRKVLLGFHGHLALASRDDCLGDTECTGRGYGLGAHIEAAFGTSGTFIPYFRYALGWEMIHQKGAYRNAEAYRYRHAFDLLDVRFGGDFVLSRGEGGRTTRLGPFAGMIVGLTVDEVSSGRSSREPDAGAGHIWFVLGVRGTMDW